MGGMGGMREQRWNLGDQRPFDDWRWSRRYGASADAAASAKLPADLPQRHGLLASNPSAWP